MIKTKDSVLFRNKKTSSCTYNYNYVLLKQRMPFPLFVVVMRVLISNTYHVEKVIT